MRTFDASKLQFEYTSRDDEDERASIVSTDGDDVTAFLGRPRLPTGEGRSANFFRRAFLRALCAKWAKGQHGHAEKGKTKEGKEGGGFSIFPDSRFSLYHSTRFGGTGSETRPSRWSCR